MKVLLPTKQNKPAALIAFALFVFIFAFSIINITINIFIFILTFLISLIFLAFSYLLYAVKGGIFFNDEKKVLQFFYPFNNVYELPLSEIVKVVVHPRYDILKRNITETLWSIEFLLKDGLRIAFGETPMRDKARRVSERIHAETNIPLSDEHFFLRTRMNFNVNHRVSVKLGYRWHFLYFLLPLALSFIVLGGFLFSYIAKSFFYGLLIAPFVGVLGIILLLYVLIRSFVVEELVIENGKITQKLEVFGITIFKNSIDADEVKNLYIRVNNRGIKGFSLDIVTPEKVLTLFAGISLKDAMRIGTDLVKKLGVLK